VIVYETVTVLEVSWRPPIPERKRVGDAGSKRLEEEVLMLMLTVLSGTPARPATTPAIAVFTWESDAKVAALLAVNVKEPVISDGWLPPTVQVDCDVSVSVKSVLVAHVVL
jgi:hypothetical protein